MLKKTLEFTGKVSKIIGKGAFKASKIGAEYVYNHREEIKGGTIGAAKQAVKAGKGIYGYTLTEKDFDKLRDKIREQQEEYRDLSEKFTYKKNLSASNTKQALYDSLFTAAAAPLGVSFSSIPEDVEEAYSLAYPNLAKEISLKDLVENSSITEVTGYINGIKGKLFELRYVDYLNETLPSGWEAHLADSATQKGWDVVVLDDSGSAVEYIQLKATNDVSYVKNALETYPDIDMVTTEEVFNQLSMNEAISGNIENGGFENSTLTEEVAKIFSDPSLVDSGIDLTPSIIPLVIIAYSVSRKKNMSSYERGEEFGGRALSSYLAYLAGGTAASISGFWPLAIGVSLLTNFGLETGRARYLYYRGLKKTVKDNEKIIRRLKTKLSHL